MWSWRLLLITGEPRYAELAERVLFNAFAAGVSLDGTSYFYVNPLQVRAGHVDPDDGRGRAARSPWYEIACCPPNVMRTLSSLGRYFATTDSTGVQIWQFAPSRISVDVGGTPLDLDVQTGYPLEGRVAVRVERATAQPLEIALRVPAWAKGAVGTVRCGPDESRDAEVEPGTLWRVTRQWRDGDELILDLPDRARVIRPHPRIDAVRGCAAFERGPLVYCLEEVDAGGAQRLESLRVDTSAPLTETEQMIGGDPVVALQAQADICGPRDDDNFPYRSEDWWASSAHAGLTLVPYFAWGNRRPGETMRMGADGSR